MELYLPEKWANVETRRDSAGIPEHVQFRTKWEMALEQIDQARESDIEVRCVTADAGYGDCSEFRDGLIERKLHYVVAVGTNIKAFDKPPHFIVPKQTGKGPAFFKPKLAKNSPKPKSVRQVANEIPAAKWQELTWRNGSKGDMRGEFVAVRVTPSHRWEKGMQHEECWLLCERPVGEKKPAKFYLSNLPRRTALKRLVDLARSRWAIEQSYEHLKDELALDHFEGRSYPGFHHHLVLTALAFTFLQLERRRSRAQELPTLNRLRWTLTEIVTAQLFASEERLSRMITDFMHDPTQPVLVRSFSSCARCPNWECLSVEKALGMSASPWSISLDLGFHEKAKESSPACLQARVSRRSGRGCAVLGLKGRWRNTADGSIDVPQTSIRTLSRGLCPGA